MKRRNLVPEVTIFDTGCFHYDAVVGCLISNDVKCAFCTNFIEKSTIDVFQLSAKHITILREKILDLQHGVCWICNTNISGSSEACLDHHHQKKNKGSGKIRAVICRTCNSLIAKNENNATRYRISNEELPRVLRSMADYLNMEQFPYLHPSEKPKTRRLRKDCYNKLVKVMTLAKEKKIPPFPEKTGKVTIPLDKFFKKYEIEVEYYK